MRPRIRTVKPEFFSDPDLNRFSVTTRFVALGLISMADDRGRIVEMGRSVAGFVSPTGDVSDRQIAASLDDLESISFVIRYEVDPWEYLWLPKFWRHQSINRPSESSLPACPDDPFQGLSVTEAMARFKDGSLKDHGIGREGSQSDHESLTPSRAGARSVPFLSSVGDSSQVSDRARARELFDLWRERCAHATAKYTDERKRKIEARLKEGYTVEQITLAIDGAARAAFVNDAGKRFDDIELICRNGSKLESFMERATPHEVAAPKQVVGGKYEAALKARSEATV